MKFIEVTNLCSGHRVLIAVDQISTVRDGGKEAFIELYVPAKNGKVLRGITTEESYDEVIAKLGAFNGAG